MSSDSGKIIIGLVVFVVLISFPIWNAVTSGQSGERPELVYPADATTCVEDKAYMKTWHMDLLNEWRDTVVRGGERTYVAHDHREYDMSLQNTCMKCHENKDTFCDRCHNYVGVAPKCWECHVEPGGVSHGQG